VCATPLADEHDHLVDLENRTLCCACRPCALLFVEAGAARGRYRTVPARVAFDPGFVLDEVTWRALAIPVRLAFLFYNSRQRRWVAVYPSPAGATESEPAIEGLRELAGRTDLISAAEADVEALLAFGPRGGGDLELLLVPITACYELVAAVRRNWRGLDGGDEARIAVNQVIGRLRARRRPLIRRRLGESGQGSEVRGENQGDRS
jgi:hypothetical protein